MGESNEGSVMKMLEGLNQPKIAQKRIKFQDIMEKGDADRISALPDSLILEILSRLPTTKHAIRTGTLCKRWTHLWTSVPTLVFTYSDLPLTQRLENRKSGYALLVDKTLTQCRQLKLKKFKVDVIYDTQFESQFNNWIRYAISCNVEELNLEFWYTGGEAGFRLDQFPFINSCFTNLRLVGCMLNPTAVISWKNLKSLCISYMYLNEDMIVKILSGSPLLETLVLESCHGLRWDDIQINASNRLSLTQCPQLKLKKFKVDSDYCSFRIQFESQLNSWIRYAIRCNVKELNLSFWNTRVTYEFKLDQILFTCSCVTELTLDKCLVNPVGEISWKNLRSLCISYRRLDEDLIQNILCGSPVLETMRLDYCYGYRLLDITSKSVKNLVVSGYINFDDKSEADIIEINAPNILSLTIQWGISLSKLLLLNVSSLVKANFNYTSTKIKYHHTTEAEMLKGFIMNLRHVKELNIGSLCSSAFSFLQAKGFIFPSNVKFHGVWVKNGYQGGALA